MMGRNFPRTAVVKHKGTVVVSGVVVADDFWGRLVGYMFRSRPHVPGILFDTRGPMQTTFMFFRLDMAFLTADGKVVKILRSVGPWRHTWFYRGTRQVLEVPAGTLPVDLKEGDSLEIVRG